MTEVTMTRSVVLKLLWLLDYCYKLGVTHAEDADDEGLAREFIANTNEAGIYGFLDAERDVTYIGWQEWMLRLQSKAQMSVWNGILTKYFQRLGRFGANYFSAILPLTMRIYCKGVSDWLAAPGAADIEKFKAKQRVWWTEQGLRQYQVQRMADWAKLECFDLERRDAEVLERETVAMGRKIALRPRCYEMFRRAMGLALITPE